MFHWIEARAFCHATEEEERVVAAVRTVVPDADIEREALAGHFGNPLVVMTARAKDSTARRAWAGIVSALGGSEILRGLDERLDEDGTYHLRLDKQAAYHGRIEVASGSDVITFHAKVASYPKNRENVVEVLRRSLEAP
jgi:RNA binding exosome subunit